MHDDKHYFLHDDGALVSADIFDPRRLSRSNKISAKKMAGRNAVVFFRHDNCSLVLRHYHRGGLPARFSRDRYLWTGIEHTRAWREYALLKFIQACELPAPRVYAAHVERLGLFYTGDIVTHCIDDTESLGERLAAGQLSAPDFKRVGATISRFHEKMIDHVDLNANNLLLDQNGGVYLIDFDRCRIRCGENVDWRRANLRRLHHSLVKLQCNSDSSSFCDSDWDSLCAGYVQSQSSTR